MIRFSAVIFALAVATSAQATPLAPLHQPDSMITQVREACGAHGQWSVHTYFRPSERRQVCGRDAFSGWPLR
jgi:hypothetical protein